MLEETSRAFYRDALSRLDRAGIEYLVGGAYAFARYTGIERHTKDFDIFIRRGDYERIAQVLGEAGYESELTFPHWLGKAFYNDDFIEWVKKEIKAGKTSDQATMEYKVPDRFASKGVTASTGGLFGGIKGNIETAYKELKK